MSSTPSEMDKPQGINHQDGMPAVSATEGKVSPEDRRRAALLIVAAGLERRGSTQQLIDAAHMVWDEVQPEAVLDDTDRKKRAREYNRKKRNSG